MKRLSMTLLLMSCTAHAISTLEQQWQTFPLSQLPQLKADDGMKGFLDLIQKQGRQRVLTSPGTQFDPANGYVNFQMGDEGFLEFIVWQSRQKDGYIVANRYTGEKQQFQIWKFNRQQVNRMPDILNVNQGEARAAYQRITGQTAKTVPKLHWEFPREGTTVKVSLNPDDKALLSKCKVISDVTYDCSDKLNVAEFRWTGTRFVKRLSK